ncbi:MAG: hypothetical protein DHS20C04_16060 [Hyphococcus sp.]|nr:MAG: hypothetical protein DHS20C04_16060 [Marinicaulis sp.]
MQTKFVASAALILSGVGSLTPLMSHAHAADHDGQVWLTAAVNIDLADRWGGVLEAQTRIGDDISTMKVSQFKGILLYDLTSTFSAGVGYGYMIANKPGGDIAENRIWQEVNWKIDSGDKNGLAFRTRLEERFFESGNDTGWRLRQRVKLTRPIRDGSSTYLFGSGEFFFALNDTDWGARDGFSESRLSAGIGARLSRMLKIEGGYLNQCKPKSAAEDDMNHVLTLSLTTKL